MSESEFEIIEGKNNVMLVAPHGHMATGYNDDEHTAELTRLVAEKLQCHAVINTFYRKPRKIEDKGKKKTEWEEPSIPKKIMNLNKLSQYQHTSLYKEFVQPIIDTAESCLKNNEHFYVFHIHGIDDGNIPKGLAILLGVGLGVTDKGNSLSSSPEYTDLLIEELNITGLETEITRHKDYAARASHNLNQLFKQHQKLDGVDSVQLEIKKEYREKTQLESTADKLIAAIRTVTGVADNLPAVVEKKADDALVSKAAERLAGIYAHHARNMLWDAGSYIIDTFYSGDIDKARSSKPIKKLSYDRLKEQLSNSHAGSPSKSWLYNAVNLVVLEDDFKKIQEENNGEGDFQALGNLTNSHKLLLLTAPDTKKMALALEAGQKKYSTRKLAERIKHEKGEKKQTLLSCISKPSVLFDEDNSRLYSAKELKGLKPNQIEEIRTRIEQEKRKLAAYLKNYDKLLQKLD